MISIGSNLTVKSADEPCIKFPSGDTTTLINIKIPEYIKVIKLQKSEFRGYTDNFRIYISNTLINTWTSFSRYVFLLANIVHDIINSDYLIAMLGLSCLFGTTNKTLDKINYDQYNDRHILWVHVVVVFKRKSDLFLKLSNN